MEIYTLEKRVEELNKELESRQLTIASLNEEILTMKHNQKVTHSSEEESERLIPMHQSTEAKVENVENVENVESNLVETKAEENY